MGSVAVPSRGLGVQTRVGGLGQVTGPRSLGAVGLSCLCWEALLGIYLEDHGLTRVAQLSTRTPRGSSRCGRTCLSTARPVHRSLLRWAFPCTLWARGSLCDGSRTGAALVHWAGGRAVVSTTSLSVLPSGSSLGHPQLQGAWSFRRPRRAFASG